MSTPTYAGVHSRLHRERGPASARACAWCGRRAAEWACRCDDESVTTGVNANGKPVTFSPLLDAYLPACRSCHRRYDAARARRARSLAHLGVAPLPKRPRRAPVERIPEPEPLFEAGWLG